MKHIPNKVVYPHNTHSAIAFKRAATFYVRSKGIPDISKIVTFIIVMGIRSLRSK